MNDRTLITKADFDLLRAEAKEKGIVALGKAAIGHEPLLMHAMSRRHAQIHAALDAANVSPEVRERVIFAFIGGVFEIAAAVHRSQQRLWADLLPDFDVPDGDDHE